MLESVLEHVASDIVVYAAVGYERDVDILTPAKILGVGCCEISSLIAWGHGLTFGLVTA